MKEKGDDHFFRSLTLALAVLALLLFLLSRFIPPLVVVPKPDLVEVQLTGSGRRAGDGAPAGEAPGGGAGRRVVLPAQGPRRVPPLPAQAATVPAQVPAPIQRHESTPPQPAPGETATTSLPPQENAQGEASRTAGPTSTGTAESGPGQGGGPGSGTGAEGDGVGVGAAGARGAGSGTADFSAGSPAATISDIDPVPLGTITATYPISARRLGQQGLVKIRADIDADGRAIACEVAASSGFASLDNAALDAVRNARFMPAMKNGRPVESLLIVPIRFRLTEK